MKLFKWPKGKKEIEKELLRLQVHRKLQAASQRSIDTDYSVMREKYTKD